jgi:hypothetical protein
MKTELNITKEELLKLTKQYSYDTVRKMLHIKDIRLNSLLMEFGIERTPKYMRRTYPEITQECKEFILGSLLGDMSVVKKGPQHRLSCSHCEEQLEYLEHKKELLGKLSLESIQRIKSKAHDIKMLIKNKEVFKTIDGFYNFILHSKVHPYFTELRNKLYCMQGDMARKIVTEWWLNQLTPRSLAYWIMDDGSAEYSDNSYILRISTCGFTQNENIMLSDFMKSKFDIEVQLQSVNRGYGWTLRLRTEASKKLRDLIIPFIPDCMRYKVDKEAWLNRG